MKINIKLMVIAPNLDNGITLTFKNDYDNLLSIETNNDGSIFVIIHNEKKESEIYEYEKF